jgi:hypothetical protein
MPATIAQARDQICKVLKDALAANMTYASTPVLWDDTEGDPPKDTKTTWIRHTIQHSQGGVASLGNSAGKKRRKRSGTMACQVFLPINGGSVTSDALVLSSCLRMRAVQPRTGFGSATCDSVK